MKNKKKKLVMHSQRLAETGHWHISPETRKRFSEYEAWLERKKKCLRRRT